jgi:hypothetical protein
MYIFSVIVLMFVCPIVSMLLEFFVFKSGAGAAALTGKWFVFWAVGVRLLTAGLRQSTNPRFTTRQILGIQSDDSFQVVQELGFANISMGSLGIASMLNSTWVVPAAIAGGLYYGLAGLRHIVKKNRGGLEQAATFSDVVISLVLLGFLAFTFVR